MDVIGWNVGRERGAVGTPPVPPTRADDIAGGSCLPRPVPNLARLRRQEIA